MRKNYFMKNLLAASMLLAVSMGMSSCSGFVDAVLGTSDKTTTQPTTQPTTAGAVVTADQTTITISSFEEMAKAVSAEQNEAFIKAIEAKAAAGEKYTINIKSEKPLSTANFEGLVIPRVVGSKIDVVFDKPLVTSESNPLKVTADEKNSDTPTDAVNELTITLPNGSDNVYLSVNMPETTVKLEGNVTYQFVEAITATNTLVVESGVTIKELQYKIGSGTSVVVKNGGVIETFVYRTDIYFMGITEKGLTYAVTPGLEFFFPIAKDENGDPYYINCLKVVKGDAEVCGLYHTFSPQYTEGSSPDLKKLIIGDGAVVCNMNYTSIPYDDIIGEGNATFLYGYSYSRKVSLSDVNSIYNVTFMPRYDSGSTITNIPSNNDKCTFITN
jgi:hypothetical protein